MKQSAIQRAAVVLLLAAALLAGGCGIQDIDRAYGRRRGNPGGDSVNGTAVLAEMFRRAGFRVSVWRRLSPKLEDAQTIVWFPDDFQPPTTERRAFLEEWLANERGRTLIYVGRDYDAAISYWKKVQPTAPPDQLLEVARRLATVQAEHDAKRALIPQGKSFDWFAVEENGRPPAAQSLGGPWSRGIDASRTEIEVGTPFRPLDEEERTEWLRRGANPWDQPSRFRPLLTAGGATVVHEVTVGDWGDSKIIVVANGSFLLNLPLVNHEHRKLAARLIGQCRPGKVVFLESGPDGPPILEQDPDQAYPTGLEVFTVWPLGIIVLHLTALGLLCCFAIYPIFGRPREVDRGADDGSGAAFALFASGHYVATEGGSDGPSTRRVVRAHFGKHIEALGELLELAQDRQYAVHRVRYYHEHVKRESGKSHRKE